MKVIIKILKGGEAEIDITEKIVTIQDLKQEIETKLKIPVAEQKLLLIGKNLSDEKNIDFYPQIKEGTKITLVQKKPENLQSLLSKHLKKHFSEQESNEISKIFLHNLNDLIMNHWSLDDLEKLSSTL